MKITVTARHTELSTGIRQFAQIRLEKLAKYANDIHGAHVIVSLEKNVHTAEITLGVNSHELVVRQQHAEAGAAIELAADRLEEQMRRLKERRIDQQQRVGGKTIPVAKADAADDDAQDGTRGDAPDEA